MDMLHYNMIRHACAIAHQPTVLATAGMNGVAILFLLGAIGFYVYWVSRQFP